VDRVLVRGMRTPDIAPGEGAPGQTETHVVGTEAMGRHVLEELDDV
jgi:hypothetical protein